MRTSTLLKTSFLVLGVQFLSGCASSVSSDFFSQTPPKDYSNMYLRGVFNWWEASEDFKLQAVTQEQYAVTIELIADGQPYDFKVADSIWTMTLNCGNEFNAEAMQTNEAVELVCASDSLNLQFTPSQTGMYEFLLDVSNNNQPELTISLTTQ